MQDIVSQMENYSTESKDEHWKEKGKNKTKQNIIRNQTPNLWFKALYLCKFSLYTSIGICPSAVKWVHHSLGYTSVLVSKNNILSMAWGIIQHTNLMRTNQDFASSIGMRVGFFPPVTAVTCIFNDCIACCLIDASFQSKCLFQLIEWHCGTSKENSWRENNREFFLSYFSETFLLCFPVYVNKLWPRESVKQKTSRLQKRRNMSTRTLSLPCLLASGGRGKRLSYKIQRTGTSETFQLKIMMLPCSVHYKNTFVTHKGEVKLQTKLCCSPLLLWCNLTWLIEPDMLC